MNKTITTRTVKSPVGNLSLSATSEGLTSLRFGMAHLPPNEARTDESAIKHLDATEHALAEYFAGRRNSFNDLNLAPHGTFFQIGVWEALRSIPYGQTRTYGDIARNIAHPGAARAVGMANNRNPIAIIIPCHRVIGADGSLVGYAAGLGIKGWLLHHEGARI